MNVFNLFLTNTVKIILSTLTLTVLMLSTMSAYAAGSAACSASTIAVTTTADNGNNASPTSGSLRAAILAANTSGQPTHISFNLSGGAPYIIKPLSQLPAFTVPICLDGENSALGWTPRVSSATCNSASCLVTQVQSETPATLVIVIDGSLAQANTNGLILNADGSTVRGVVINNFTARRGVFITLNGQNNVVSDNYIGTDVSGKIKKGLAVDIGILINSSNNQIGGAQISDRNVIGGLGSSASGARGRGIVLNTDPPTIVRVVNTNTILGNLIGVGADGVTPINNFNRGIHQTTGDYNLIKNNIISNSRFEGLISRGGINNNYDSNVFVRNNLFGIFMEPTGCYIGSPYSTVLKGNIVQNNVFQGNLIAGAVLSSTDCAPGTPLQLQEYNIFQNNLVSGSPLAVLLQSEPANDFSAGSTPGYNNGTRVLNNTLIGSGPIMSVFPPVWGLQLGPSVFNADIENNDISGFSDYGVVLASNVTNAILKNNIIHDNAGDGIVASLYLDGNDIFNDPLGRGPTNDLIINNTIYNNGRTGILVGSDFLGNPIGNAQSITIVDNSIYNNGSLGIDLSKTTKIEDFTQLIGGQITLAAGDGVTFNDSVGHGGANNFQNAPILDPIASFRNPALVQVEGDLYSDPNTQYDIQIFSSTSAVCLQLNTSPPLGYLSSPGCNVDSGFTTAFLAGQGQVLIGEIKVLTDATGHAHFRFPAKVASAVGNIITATATKLIPDGNGTLLLNQTSEFSQAIDVCAVGSATAYLHANGAPSGNRIIVLDQSLTATVFRSPFDPDDT